MELGLMLVMVSTMVRQGLITGVAMLHKIISSNHIQAFLYDPDQCQVHLGFVSLATSLISMHRK